MIIDTTHLREITLQVAKEKFGEQIFARRRLMEAVEQKLRDMSIWDSVDDEDSQSVGKKSKGMARIDWSISKLKKEGRLLNVGRDKWKVPPG